MSSATEERRTRVPSVEIARLRFVMSQRSGSTDRPPPFRVPNVT